MIASEHATTRRGPDSSTERAAQGSFIKDPALIAALQRCKQTDNYTNLCYILRTWLLVALVFGTALWFLMWRAERGLHWSFDLCVLLIGVPVIGALQHQLAALGHEGSHFTLFRNRKLNEVMADVFCFIPLFTSTHSYRLQHLAHHKYVNDPVEDPDLYQLLNSGHHFEFPKSRREVLRLFVSQLWPINQIRYVFGRLKHLGVRENEVRVKNGITKRSRIVALLLAVCIVSMIVLFDLLTRRGDALLLAGGTMAFAAVTLLIAGSLPTRWYGTPGARCPIPMRVFVVLRLAVFYAMLYANGWIAFSLGARIGHWTTVLWVAPLLTTFALFNMLRQILHHANADRGWYSNSRNFFVNPLTRFSVFPFGQDIHLVHHMFSSIPHYNLRPLHEKLMQHPEYRERTVRVEGWYLSNGAEPRNPTATEVLGPEYTPSVESTPFVDHSVDEGLRG